MGQLVLLHRGALSANGTREWIKGTLAEGKAVPRMHEWRIDPASGAVTSERWLFDDIVEVGLAVQLLNAADP